MYKEGLGDCFLLTFQGGPKPVHMLIDCGVIVGTKDASTAMTSVVTDLKAATGGHLDVVVATHEHWDHISGFMQAKPVFDTIAIDQVWLAWTEEPGNTRAQELKDEFGLQLKAVRQAMTKWGPGLQPRLRAAVEEVLTFAGDGLAAGGPTTADALTYLKKTRHEATQRYLTPGETPFAVPGVDGVRVFVLGPPSADEYVRRLLPRKHSEDAYEMRLTATRAFAAALPPAGGPAEDEEARRLAFPFDEYYMIPKDQGLSRGDDDFFRRYYGPAPGASEPDLGWRRIDEDWLTVAGQLALDLDNKTNNTCLVLAFEIIATGEVLLFPGDAQIGNWESWKTVTFTVPDGNGHTRTVTSAREEIEIAGVTIPRGALVSWPRRIATRRSSSAAVLPEGRRGRSWPPATTRLGCRNAPVLPTLQPRVRPAGIRRPVLRRRCDLKSAATARSRARPRHRRRQAARPATRSRTRVRSDRRPRRRWLALVRRPAPTRAARD